MNPATNLATKLAQIYPGVYNPQGQDDPADGDADTAHKLPTKPLNTLKREILSSARQRPNGTEITRVMRNTCTVTPVPSSRGPMMSST